MATKKLDDKLARTERDILWAAFRKQGTEPSLWARENHSVLAAASWCATMHHAAPTALRTLLIMCSELGIPMATVKAMLIARGETIVASMLKEDMSRTGEVSQLKAELEEVTQQLLLRKAELEETIEEASLRKAKDELWNKRQEKMRRTVAKYTKED